MSATRAFTYGLGLGAATMFLLDPRQGGSRRAIIRDKSRRAVHEVEDAVQIGSRDLAHRLEGAIARVFAPRSEATVPDDVLVARVRARLGRVTTHPRAIEVKSKGNGGIELKGPVLAKEAERVLSAVSHVRGVREVDDDLVIFDTADDVPALQGQAAHAAANVEAPVVRLWMPSTRLLLGFGAASVALTSLVRGNPIGFLLGGAGMLALARSIVQRSAYPSISQHPPELAAKGSNPQSPQEKTSSSAAGPDVQPLREAYPPTSEWAPQGATPGREQP